MAEYIDREALLKDIEESVVFTVRSGKPSLEIRGANAITDRIKSATAADVEEVKHGRWIEKRIALTWCEDDVDIFYTCSVCGAGSPSETFYCHNCGAKMDGGKDETK